MQCMYSIVRNLLLLFALLSIAQTTQAQSNQLQNGDFEQWEDAGLPTGWRFYPFGENSPYKLRHNKDDAVQGESAVTIDAMQADAADSSFGNLSQTIDATEFRGKRIEFSARVRVSEYEDMGRAQLWFRVDRPGVGNQPRIGAFDNMQDRPIRDDQWQTYKIVGDIDDDALRITVGMLILGKAVASIDGALLTIVDDSVPETGKALGSVANNSVQPSDQAQPFFNHWLWLPLVALLLFSISHGPVKTNDGQLIDSAKSQSNRTSLNPLELLFKFAFRFSFAYWIAYSFPKLLVTFIPYGTASFARWYQGKVDSLVRWTGEHIFKIEGVLVAPNGSGDTTYSYIQAFLCFVLAIAIAIIWSLADWRKTDYRWLKDLLRSYLRYVLAITMLGYGLAKTGWIMNQFPEPDVDRLMKPYGESSPMNILWTFMGASRPYTIFAGMGEVIGGLLLVFRRTTILGALVVIGVMTNVVVLNFCYDVPVKLYSTHLLCMAFFILLPDVPRLLNLFLFNRRVEKVSLRAPYLNEVTIWIQRVIKCWVIFIAFGWPIGQQIKRECFDHPESAPSYFGSYRVVSFTRDGKEITEDDGDPSRWTRITLRRLPWSRQPDRTYTDYFSIYQESGAQMLELSHVTARSMKPKDQSSWSVKVDDEGKLELTGVLNGNKIRAEFVPVRREDFLLVNRGFRWINEYPYNR
jgi:hypothetical protein